MNTTNSLTSTPDCLRRTVSDDRAEADLAADLATPGATLPVFADKRDELLAAIQRREAEAVRAKAPLIRQSTFTLPRAAAEAAQAAVLECTDNRLTLAQRATLLDAARSLVRLAIEVAS